MLQVILFIGSNKLENSLFDIRNKTTVAGACIASLLSQGGTWERHPNLKWLKRFKNDRERRDLVTCGASAGVAAAFRAPVGGLLFGLEAMSSHWSQHLLLSCFFTTAVVSVTARSLMRMCSSGGCGFFGEGNFIIFHISDAQARRCQWFCFQN